MIVAAPVKDDRALNVVVGVNDQLYEPERHRLLTAASCTTNCLAPVVKVVHEAIGIRHGQITTIHDPTNTNVVVDAPHKDLRRARSAMLSLQPTTTGSATAIALIYPELKGKLNGHAVRAPVLNASLTDCVFEMKRATTEAEVNELFAVAAKGPLAGILGYETRPLVSADYCNDTRSSIVDAPSTLVTDGTLLKVYAWYDNEMGYVCRMVDLANHRDRRGSVMAQLDDSGNAPLPGRHGLLLGLHPGRRRVAHAGAAAFLQARLFALHARLPVPALRVRRHRRQPLAAAGWRPASASRACWPWARPCRSPGWQCCRRSIRAGPRRRRSPGWWQPRALPAWPRISPRPRRRSAIKATSAEGSGQLFKWVACFTGSKNAMKGVGFFVGGLLLEVMGFKPALWLMAGVIGVIFLAGLALLPRQLGKAKASKTVREFFAKSRGVNLLAAARVFLFGAREVWFVVGLPVFLYAAGWRFVEVGAFLAAWTIAYGMVQAAAPALVTRSRDGLSREVPNARLWAGLLTTVPLALGLLLRDQGLWHPDLVVVAGLALFAVPFAVNSSLHSYLILAYAGSEKAAEDVGFYYAANATGRLIGILLSGALYQLGGMTACLFGSAAMLAVCWATTFLLPAGETPRGQAA